MKKISRLLMGVAAMTMLASCAKTITSAEAAKIIASWNYSQAIGNYSKFIFHTQEDGLPTYSKAISGETWSDVSYAWSK